jgi:activator of HSP90 ATPase
MNELPTSGSPTHVTGWAMESSDQKLTGDEKLLHGTLTYLKVQQLGRVETDGEVKKQTEKHINVKPCGKHFSSSP